MTRITEAPLLQLTHVHRRRANRPAVADLNLTLHCGEVLGLLGTNGAGKSTTLSMIAGALAPQRGTITLEGEDLAGQRQACAARIGWLPERAPVWAELTVDEHLDAHGRLHGLRGDALRQACQRAREALDLGSLRRRLAGVLSQGQRQRLGLACALLAQPALLVLDEPATALDPVQTATLHALIRAHAAAGNAVILSTHILGEVTAVCDRVAILHEGVLRLDTPLHVDGHAALEATFFQIATQPPTAVAA